MPQCKVFIVKLLAIYRLSTGAVVVCKVATLAHLTASAKKANYLECISMMPTSPSA